MKVDKYTEIRMKMVEKKFFGKIYIANLDIQTGD